MTWPWVVWVMAALTCLAVGAPLAAIGHLGGWSGVGEFGMEAFGFGVMLLVLWLWGLVWNDKK